MKPHHGATCVSCGTDRRKDSLQLSSRLWHPGATPNYSALILFTFVSGNKKIQCIYFQQELFQSVKITVKGENYNNRKNKKNM
jgi:hypothetical protein